jgi:hypothetical protein
MTRTPLALHHPLCSPWKYNSDVEEFFVEDETVVKLKKSDVTRRMETTDLDDRDLVGILHTQRCDTILIYIYISSCHVNKWQSITRKNH